MTYIILILSFIIWAKGLYAKRSGEQQNNSKVFINKVYYQSMFNLTATEQIAANKRIIVHHICSYSPAAI